MLGLLLSAGAARAQGDPLELQKRAVARIDAFVEFFRRTGDMRSQLPVLVQADAELTASNRLLAGRADWTNLAVGLIKQGHLYRFQARWPDAILLYRAAEETARRAGNVVHQSDALAWRALAESSQSNISEAFADATESGASRRRDERQGSARAGTRRPGDRPDPAAESDCRR